MAIDVEQMVARVRRELTRVAVADHAEPMARYMKDHFPFLGVKTPARRSAVKFVVQPLRDATPAELADFARACWAEPEREFQYVAADVLARTAPRFGWTAIDLGYELVTAKSWWDTVDALASPFIGRAIQADPAAWRLIDGWLDEDGVWVPRASLLQQLRYKEQTDQRVLFDRCLRRADDPEFFIRKAIGWALREYSKVEPDAVRAFVADHEAVLSPLSRREALKWVDRQGSQGRQAG